MTFANSIKVKTSPRSRWLKIFIQCIWVITNLIFDSSGYASWSFPFK